MTLFDTRIARTSSTLSSSSSLFTFRFQGGLDHRAPGLNVAGRSHRRIGLAEGAQHRPCIVEMLSPRIVDHVAAEAR